MTNLREVPKKIFSLMGKGCEKYYILRMTRTECGIYYKTERRYGDKTYRRERDKAWEEVFRVFERRAIYKGSCKGE